jgi:hypothetical protein
VVGAGLFLGLVATALLVVSALAFRARDVT